ncbi:hypothetical protein [Streptacidiphilus jiangxiensis]|uniref:Subtilisin inhibitor-like n=1 Tax=Streptacidiphilus jiangxiensis TaxID=235985 RepID=A0A1H7HUE9_STRJI|nr:hypothetical protein [Streptacidiphilus jiangxiensis]SEK51825.1 hypothetical protein SAMN05414137_102286 [Streptacidiphilus jiangxiensis]
MKRLPPVGHALLTGATLAVTVALAPPAAAAPADAGHWQTLSCDKGQAAYWEPLNHTPGIFLQCDRPDDAASAVTTGMMATRFERENAIAAQLQQDHDLTLGIETPCRVGDLASVSGRFGQCVADPR